MQHFVQTEAQDVTVRDGHAFQTPVVGGLADLLIKFGALLPDPFEDPADEDSQLWISKFQCCLAIDALQIGFGVLVQQKEHLEYKATGF